MGTTKFDLSFSRRRSQSGPYVRDFLAGLLFRARTARHKHAARGPMAGGAMDRHLLRDIGLTRLGMRESALTKHNEAG